MEANLKILGRPYFWPLNPILAKAQPHFGKNGGGVPNLSLECKNSEMSFLIIKSYLLLQNSNRNKFLWQSVNKKNVRLYKKKCILKNWADIKKTKKITFY